MTNTITIDCPDELLIGLHFDSEQFADFIKVETAVSLFKDGKISSGMVSSWLNVSRVKFLMKAFDAGAAFMDDNEDDFRRETAEI